MTRRIVLIASLFEAFACMLVAQSEEAAAVAENSLSSGGGHGWVVGVNLVIWTGLFLYLLSLHGKIRGLEKKS